MSKLRKLATIYNIEEKFDNKLKEKFYKGTEGYLTEEEQNIAWNGGRDFYEINGKNMTEEQIDKFLSLLHKYGMVKDDSNCIFFENEDIFKEFSYLEAMMLGMDLDYAFYKQHEDLYTMLFPYIVEKLIKDFGFTQADFNQLFSKMKLDNYDDFGDIICNLYSNPDFGDIIRSATKPQYSYKKCVLILRGFDDGLNVEEIINKIKEDLPRNQW